MRLRTNLVRILAFVSILVGACFAGAQPKVESPLFKLECGTYRGIGYFGLNSKSHFVFSLNRTSSSPTEFLVIGGNPDDKAVLISQHVLIEFYVPKPIEGSRGKNVVFLQKLSAAKASEETMVPQLITKEACGLNEKFSD